MGQRLDYLPLRGSFVTVLRSVFTAACFSRYGMRQQAGARNSAAHQGQLRSALYPSMAGPSNCFNAWTYSVRAWRPVSVMR
jgi:hypothetical protein